MPPVQVKAVQEYLKELLENTDQKLLIFAHHRDLLDGVEFVMNKYAAAPKAQLGSRLVSLLGTISISGCCWNSCRKAAQFR